MNADIAIAGMFFSTVVLLSLGIPLVRAFTRNRNSHTSDPSMSPELMRRLDRIESMVETVSVEVERLAEGQRFTTKVLSQGAAQPVGVPPRNEPRGRGENDSGE